jgi:hypothetical protein
MLAAGEVLKHDKYVNAQKVQDYIQQDESFGVRPPLGECRLALRLLEDSGFLMPSDTKEGDEQKYERATLLMVYDKWNIK